MADIIGHHFVKRDQAILLNVIVELSARKRMSDRNLNGFDVELLCKVDALTNGVARFTRQSYDEIAVNRKAELFAVCGKAPRHIDSGAFFYVLQDLLIARFIANDEKAATSLFHGLQSVVIGGDARRTTPREVQLL